MRITRLNLLISGLFLVFIDQLSKYLIRSQGGPARSASLNDAGGFYICNEGIAFGIKLPEVIILCLSIALVLFLVCLIFNFKFIENYKSARVGATLIIAGAAANIWDRLIYGCVIDFIDLRFWPVFNLADSFIVFGAIILISSYLNKQRL